MKKLLFTIPLLLFTLSLRAWWDPGHLVVAMIAYENLSPRAKARVDELTGVLQRDYPYVNHFIATGPWPDDLKAEGVRAYDTWHYTNIPYNVAGVALPDRPEVDVIWAINESLSILQAPRAKEIDKARFLAFLVHFVADLHQPLHSTTLYTDDNPSGNLGGNEFALQGPWRNLHMLWDDGVGYLSPLNDISPYGQPKEPLTPEEIERVRRFARDISREFPESGLTGMDVLDPDFWALESHKLAVQHVYRSAQSTEEGRSRYLAPDDTPSERYLEQAQPVVRQRLAAAGYRLARILNEVFGE